MNLTSYLRPVWLILLFSALQILVFRNFSLWNTGFCFVYIAGILLLPLGMNGLLVMLLAFFTGLFNDIFMSTPGMQAAAAVATAFARITMIRVLTPPGGYEGDDDVSTVSRGWAWYLQYMIPLVFINNFLVFAIDYAELSKLHVMLINAVVSTVLTLVVIWLVQQFITHRKTGSRLKRSILD